MIRKTAAPSFAVVILALSVVGLPGCGTRLGMRTPDPAVRYIAFGDSTTAGPAERDYIDFLPELMEQPEEAFTNEGKGGETTPEGLTRLSELLEAEVFPNAETLLYWEGGNDITDFIKGFDPLLLFSPDEPDYLYVNALTEVLDDIQTNIEAAIGVAAGAGLDVYVATYYPLAPGFSECDPLPFDILLPGQAQTANAYITLLNQRIRAAARNRGARVVDVADRGNVFVSDPENYFNCNHLSATGNQIVAGLFQRTIIP